MDRQEFIKSRLFENVMSNNGFDNWSNYIGPDWSSWLCGPSYNRDSHVFDQSNFDTALERLGGEQAGIVEVRDVNHWACGWFKQIMVKADNEKAVDELISIYNDLDAYPLLDEDDASEREHDQFCDTADQECKGLAEAMANYFKIRNNSTLKNIAYHIIYDTQSNSGGDSYLTEYDFRREVKRRDLVDLKRNLENARYSFKKSKTFNRLVDAVNKAIARME